MQGNYKGSWVLTRHGLKAVFLSIAELNGYKIGTIKGKMHFGVQCWLNETYHDLNPIASTTVQISKTTWKSLKRFLPLELQQSYSSDHRAYQAAYNKAELARAEKERADIHENIWLSRLYSNLDQHFRIMSQTVKQKALTNRAGLKFIFGRHKDATHKWNVPIELDATASMLQWYGIYLNDERLLLKTNVLVKDGKLNDAWTFEGIPRTQYKFGCTPILYGSSQACYNIWNNKNIPYTKEQVTAFNKEITTGALGAASAFKDFLIDNCKPSEKMKIKIFNEEFTIECNRFKHIGDVATKYSFYDSPTKSVRTIINTKTKSVPDLDQFRRYFPTGLIHNTDSQAANYVSGKAMEKYGWMIDIYDAFIVHPNMARDVRRWYNEFQLLVYNNRARILTDFFTSIGIGAEAQQRWDKVRSLVQPCTKFEPHYMALK